MGTKIKSLVQRYQALSAARLHTITVRCSRERKMHFADATVFAQFEGAPIQFDGYPSKRLTHAFSNPNGVELQIRLAGAFDTGITELKVFRKDTTLDVICIPSNNKRIDMYTSEIDDLFEDARHYGALVVLHGDITIDRVMASKLGYYIYCNAQRYSYFSITNERHLFDKRPNSESYLYDEEYGFALRVFDTN